MPENTPNLDLYLKNPVTDGADTFNIETMLNENFRKIDEKTARVGVDGKLDPTQRAEPALITVAGDLNTYKTKGSYYVPTGILNTPFDTNSYYMQVYSDGPLVLQILYGRVNPNLLFMRRFNSTWSEWDNYSKGITNGITSRDEFDAHKADDAIDAHNAKSISVVDVNAHFTGTNVETVLEELFTFANSGKTDIASVIGSPATSGDTFTQLKTHIQTSKNDLATNLTAKGQTSAGTETLDALVDKVLTISTGSEITTGEFNFYSEAVLYDTTSLTYEKRRTVTLNLMGTYRIEFSLELAGFNPPQTVWGRIYKNGVPYGIERSITNVAGTGLTTIFTEDLYFEEGDTCEFWVKTNGTVGTRRIKNIKIKTSAIYSLS